MEKLYNWRLFLRVVTTIMLCAELLPAQTITFRKVADTTTPIPGGTGNFTQFVASPVIDRANVAFVGRGSSGQVGVYIEVDGVLGVVADTTTPIPNGTGTFTDFSEFLSIDGSVLAFRGSGSDGQLGIYSTLGGALDTVVDLNTSIPNGTGSFLRVDPPWLSGTLIVFEGTGADGQDGVYLFSAGVLSPVADTTTAIPDGVGHFEVFSGFPTVDNGQVSFFGRDLAFTQGGVYSDVGGALRTVADFNTPLPGGSGNFTGFLDGLLGAKDGNIVFNGQGATTTGIYAEIDGVLNVVADTNTPVPDGGGNFLALQRFPSIDGVNTAFEALGNGGSGFGAGIFTMIGGSLVRILFMEDELDGKMVYDAYANRKVISVNKIAIGVSFMDDQPPTGVFVASIEDLCGNGVVEAGEECDDGNKNPGDGCTPACIDQPIPTVSQWGLIALTLLLITFATVIVGRERPRNIAT